MKNKKNIIIIVSIIAIIIVITIILKNNNKPLYKDPIEVEVMPDEAEQVWKDKEEKILPISNMNNVVEIKNCLETYFNSLYNNSEESKKIVYNCLALEYINRKNISEEDINIEDNEEFDSYVEIYSSYSVTRNNNVDLFYVKGLVRNKRDLKSKEFNLAIVLDLNNHTFEIYPDDYFDKDFFINIESGEMNTLSYSENVENRKYNTYVSSKTKSEMYYQLLFNNIRNLLSYDIEKAYELLDKENSSIKSLDEMKEFYNDNKRNIFLMAYGSSSVEYGESNSSIIITCFDKNDEIYITFYMDGYGKYTYTIDTL